jgi:hypothetical protein
MDIKKILGFILGAGMGWIGTAIRVAGYFVNKGFIDAAGGAAFTDQIVGVILTVLAALGSYLNNGVQLAKTPE